MYMVGFVVWIIGEVVYLIRHPGGLRLDAWGVLGWFTGLGSVLWLWPSTVPFIPFLYGVGIVGYYWLKLRRRRGRSRARPFSRVR